MRLRWLRRSSLAVAIALVALLASGVAISYAVNGGSTSVFYACAKANGELKSVSVDVAPMCNKNETLVSWNAEGPQGIPGPQGPQGLQGPQGIQGPEGEPGSSVAYAVIMGSAGDVVRDARSKNIAEANVVKPAGTTGVYCFVNLSFEWDVFVAMPIFGALSATANGGDTTVFGIDPHPCNPPPSGVITGGSDAWIEVRNHSGTLVDRPFYVIFN